MTPVEFVSYCNQFVGLPYIWGADGPDAYDCSGLVQKLLARLALDPPNDQSAAELHRYFSAPNAGIAIPRPMLGALAFFGKPRRIGHVGFCLDDIQMIEAAGGNDETTSIEIAKQIGAMVKINPVTRRHDLVVLIKPLRLPWET